MQPSTVIIVKNFEKAKVTRDHLAKFFTFCGNISVLTIVPDQSDQSLGIAIVNFQDGFGAEIAVQLTGAVFHGRAITIRSAPPNFITPSPNPNDSPLPIAMEGEKTPAMVFTRLISNGYTLHNDLMEKYKSKTVEKNEKQEIQCDTKWEIFPANGSILGSCALMSAHGTFLRANPGGQVDLQEVAGPWETFTIHSYGESLVSLRTFHDTYLSAASGMAGSDVSTKKTAGASEQWVLIHHGGCDYSLQSTYGTYIRAYLGGEGGKVDLQPSMTSQWEVFRLIGREPNKSIKTCFNNYVRAHPGPDGSKVDLKEPCGAWETFTIEKVDDKIVFQSMHGTFLCAHPGDNGRIELHSRKGLSEKWTMIVHHQEPKCYSFQSCHGTFLRANQNNSINLRACELHELTQNEKFTIGAGVIPLEKIVASKVSGKFASIGDSIKSKVSKK